MKVRGSLSYLQSDCCLACRADKCVHQISYSRGGLGGTSISIHGGVKRLVIKNTGCGIIEFKILTLKIFIPLVLQLWLNYVTSSL